MEQRPQLNDKQWLAQEYEANKRELNNIAAEIGCTTQAVRYALSKFEIVVRAAKKKYPKLYDPAWMRKCYEVEKKSTSDIAQEIGCDSTTILKALKRLGIKRRESGESIKILNDKKTDKSVYKELNDSEWLRKRYEVDGLSTKQIAALVGTKTPNSVRQALLRHGIVVRSVRDGWLRSRDGDGFKINQSIVTGILLGDGGLSVTKDAEESWPRFYVKHALLEHCKFVYKLLFPDQRLNGTRIKYEPAYLKDGAQHDVFVVSSLSHQELVSWYEDWYPSGIKVVPKKLKIDETVLLHWFLDDGTTSFRKRADGNIRNGKAKGQRGQVLTKQVELVFCSESFTKEEQQFLCNRFNERFDLGMRIRSASGGTGYRIHIPQSKTDHFFNTIGPCPTEIPSLAYKWK